MTTRRFTTADLENLTEGTTPGPWFASVRGFGRIENIGPISPGFSIGDGLDCDEEDADLAAAAPDLAADYHRVRTELEAWLAGVEEDLAEEHVTSHADLDAAMGAWSAQKHGELGETLNTRDHLKAILNGDTNE